MNEKPSEQRNHGWKWVVISLVVLIVLTVTCIFSVLWGGLIGFAVGRGSSHCDHMGEYYYDGPSAPEVSPTIPDVPEIPRYFSQRAWLGVSFVTNAEGALVTVVIPDSPADDAGIEVEDVIIAVDDDDVTPDYPLDQHILGYSPGDRVTITLLRNGREITVRVRLGSRSDSGLRWYEDGFPVPELMIPDAEG